MRKHIHIAQHLELASVYIAVYEQYNCQYYRKFNDKVS